MFLVEMFYSGNADVPKGCFDNFRDADECVVRLSKGIKMAYDFSVYNLPQGGSFNVWTRPEDTEECYAGYSITQMVP